MDPQSLPVPVMDSAKPQSKGTPIKVRGKKHRPKPADRRQIAKAQAAHESKARKAVPTYTANTRQALVERATQPTASSTQPVHKWRSQSHVSAIEKLPFEILHYIFLLCLTPSFDLGLIRASPLIGARLSDSYVYNQYCRRAFRHVKDSAGVTYSLPNAPPVFDENLIKGRNQALRCRWMTWNYFQVLCTRLNIEGQQHLQKVKYLTSTQLEQKCAQGWPKLILKPSHIPIKLLRVPILEDTQILFLEALINAGGGIDPVGSFTAEYANDMYRYAVEHHNEHLQSLLLDNDINWFPWATTIHQVLHLTDYEPALVWRLHDAHIKRDEPYRRIEHGQWCTERFPFTDAGVMASLSQKNSTTPPKCWDEYNVSLRMDGPQTIWTILDKKPVMRARR
ncbi:hypothetical protein FH972_021216 [Carpinus fangiana]|uniref:Uncharacterized protein n=1 Tax=Carpinus fangiana TaxID=176857 RepID=A0A5N6KP95_9ROSI|nr:hypothetical protein FH972_021216 [Carpinus fangiana]